MPVWKRVWRFWLFVGRNFVDNRCMIRASALAYTMLLALVPLLAVGISFATSFLQGDNGREQIQKITDAFLDKVAPQIGLVSKTGDGTDARSHIVDVINSAIQNISSGALGATAVIALIFTAISLLSSIETTLNDIWGIRQGRSWAARIPQYFTAIAMGGLLIMAMGLNAGPYFDATRRILDWAPRVASLVYGLLPVVLLILILGFFYQLMPNTRVHWKAALVGGICAGVLLHLNNTFSTLYFGQVVRNSKIYGSLGTIPVLLIGMYFSWVIVLFGAQVSYAFQNRRSSLQDEQAQKVNQRDREFIALRVMTDIGQRFDHGESAATALNLGEALGIPTRLIQLVLEPLLRGGLLVEVAGSDLAYVPARSLSKISSHDILDAMRSGVGREVQTREDPVREHVRANLDKIRKAERDSAQEITLDRLVRGFQTEPSHSPA